MTKTINLSKKKQKHSQPLPLFSPKLAFNFSISPSWNCELSEGKK